MTLSILYALQYPSPQCLKKQPASSLRTMNDCIILA